MLRPVCKNPKNLDGRFKHGVADRYKSIKEGGEALSNGKENSSVEKCKELCNNQIECKLKGNHCKSTAYPKDGRCYCTVCSTE